MFASVLLLIKSIVLSIFLYMLRTDDESLTNAASNEDDC